MTALRAPNAASKKRDGSEESLWAQYEETKRTSDREALCRYYLPLAKRIASQHFRAEAASPVEFDELFQLACTGLLESIDRFKPELGVPFKYYANRRIGGAILNGISKSSELNQQIAVRKRQAHERLASLNADQVKDLSIDEMLEALGELATGLALGILYEESGLYSAEGVEPGKNAFETLSWKQTLSRVRDEVEQLSARERDIMRLHYHEHLPFDQIANMLGLSKGRISQLHKSTIALLRKRLLNNRRFMLEG